MKKTIGTILTYIGGVSPISIISCTPHGIADKNLLHLLWAVPTAIITLPLLPVYLLGEKMLGEVEREEFINKTWNLPRVKDLGENFSYIEPLDDDGAEWIVNPQYYMGSGEDGIFSSYKEAEDFLIAQGFSEVVHEGYTESYSTYWIK